MALQFKMITPQTTLLEEEVASLTIMTELGEITVLPGHIPLVAALRPGEARVVVDGEERAFAVFGGFLQVKSENQVVVLADEAERVEDLVLEEIEQAQDRAKQALTEKAVDTDFEETVLALERAAARSRLARKYKAKGLNYQQKERPEKAE